MARLYAEMGSIADAARAYDRAVQSGAEPDPEFEKYLRHHPEISKKPGTDLVAEIRPEDEAARLRANDEEANRLLAENAEATTPTEPVADTQPSEQAPPAAAPEVETPLTEEQKLDAELARVQALEIKATSRPSTAGKAHKSARTSYTTVRVRTNAGGYRHRVKLRLKRTGASELRTRDGKIIKPAENTGKTGKKKKNRRKRSRN